MTQEKTGITGVGICCSSGSNLDSVWKSLEKREVNNRVAEDTFFQPHSASPLFTVNHDDILSLCAEPFLAKLNPTFLKGINRTTALLLKSIDEACHTAKLRVESLQSKRVGIAVGTTVGCTFHNESYYINWKQNRPQELTPVYTYLSSNLAERLQRILGASGPRAVITNACASGTDAIGLAKKWLENDLCDIVIAGGSDEISRIACHGFSSLMLFSPVSCTPFDRQRAGLNLGEGAAVVILENVDHSTSREIRPLGYLLGYGTAGDAYHPTAPHPKGKGLQQAIKTACDDAGCTLSEISYINAHGTGTKANDIAEITALYELGITENNAPPIISTKGATGHTLGAAGAIEAVLTLKTLVMKKTWGTIGCTEQDPALPLPVLRAASEQTINGSIGMSQSLAFGGTNSALIMEAAE